MGCWILWRRGIGRPCGWSTCTFGARRSRALPEREHHPSRYGRSSPGHACALSWRCRRNRNHPRPDLHHEPEAALPDLHQ